MAKLVAFYSRADENYFSGGCRYIAVGNTEKVAKMISEAAGADLFKIEQKVPYAADYDTCIRQAKEDLLAKARPELVFVPDSLDGYDEIYVGYPNYWGDMPMAVYSFLEKYDWNGKTVYPFCTHEGSGLRGTEQKIQSVCKGAKVAKGLAVQGSFADHGRAAVEKWVSRF